MKKNSWSQDKVRWIPKTRQWRAWPRQYFCKLRRQELGMNAIYDSLIVTKIPIQVWAGLQKEKFRWKFSQKRHFRVGFESKLLKYRLLISVDSQTEPLVTFCLGLNIEWLKVSFEIRPKGATRQNQRKKLPIRLNFKRNLSV